MAVDFTSLVASMRRVTQEVLGADGYYEDPDVPGLVELRVRWHNRVAIIGDSTDAGYANIIDGVNRVIFHQTELDEKGIVLQRGGRITFAHPALVGVSLILGEVEPKNGPLEVIWQVAA